MIEYQENKDYTSDPPEVSSYTRSTDGAFIPPDPANRDYKEMLELADMGEAKILPAEDEPESQSPTVIGADVVASRKFVLIDEEGNEKDVTDILRALAN